MWVTPTNGRKSKKQSSLDKIKQYIKLTEKSPFGGSVMKTSTIPSLLKNEKSPSQKENNNDEFSSMKGKIIKQSHSAANILAAKINFSSTRGQLPTPIKDNKVGISALQKDKILPQTPKIPSENTLLDLPYFVECTHKKHRLLGEMHIFIHNAISTFKDYLKCCQAIKQKSPLKLTPETAGKKTIVFDMDETLIHTNQKITPHFELRVPFRSYQGRIGYGYVNIRPYAKEVLSRLSKHFDILIFTASSQAYADPILDYLDPERNIIQHRLYRQHCTLVKNQLFVKDLRVINRKLENIVLVDNAPYSFMFQLNNGIPILPYYRGKQDRQLIKLQQYLISLQEAEDVRHKNKQHFYLSQYTKYDNHQKLITNIYHKKWPKAD